MTDQELIQFLQDNLPQDLPPDLLEAVRRRIQVSPSLRQAVMIELKLEQGLATALAPTPQRWEELLAQHAHRERSWRHSVLLICVLLCAAVTVVAVVLSSMSAKEAPPQGGLETAGQPASSATTSAVDKPDQPPTPTVAAVPFNLPPADRPETAPATTPALVAGATDAAPPTEAAPAPVIEAAPAAGEDAAGKEPPLTPELAEVQLFDNPAIRQDVSWREHWNNVLAPFDPSRTIALGGVLILRGDYQIVGLPDEHHLLRMPYTGGSNVLEFWAGTEGVRIASDGGARPVAYHLRRDSEEPVSTAPAAKDATYFGLANQQWRVDPQIDFEWTNQPPIADWPASSFCVRWEGQIQAPRDGAYKFRLTGDDGARLTIDGTKIAEKWVDTKDTSAGEIKLTSGWHNIVVEYYQTAGKALIRLEWEGPDIERQVVPTESLRPHQTPPLPSQEPDMSGLVLRAGLSIDTTEVGNARRPAMEFKPTDRGLLGRYSCGPVLSVAARSGTPPQATDVRRVSDDGFRQRLMSDIYMMDFRYQDGQLVLSRGDTVMLTAPLAHAPTSAFYRADNSYINYAAHMPCLPLAIPQRQPGRAAPNAQRPAELSWVTEPEDAAGLRTMPNGAVELASPAQPNEELPVIRAMADFGPAVGTQVDLHASQLTPGAGFVFAGPRDGNVNTVWIAREEEKGRLVLVGDPGNPDERVRATAEGWTLGDQVWLRLIFATRAVRVLISHDGEHWASFAEFGEGDASAPGATSARCGLIVNALEPTARIALDHVRVRRFDAAINLADAALVAKVPATTLEQPGTLDQIITELDRARPADTSPEDWRLAECVAILQGPGPIGRRHPALARLIEQATQSGRPPAQIEQVLAQLPWLVNLVPPTNLDQLSSLYNGLSQHALSPEDAPTLDRLLTDWLQPPLTPYVEGARPRSMFPADLLRTALWQHVTLGQWPQAARLARRALFLSQYLPVASPPAEVDLFALDLAGWVAASSSDASRQVDVSSVWLDRWTHPLASEADRDTAAVMNEFLASVRAQAYEHACRILTQRMLPTGLAPQPADPRLLQSPEVVLNQTLGSDATLRQTLHDQFTDLSELRLKQAINSNSTEMLRAITVQFYRTPAAAAALTQLADQNLVEGDFRVAAAHYQELLKDYDLSDTSLIAAKRRLAMAMTGIRVGQPVTQTVHLPGGDISAADFESLIDQSVRVHESEAALTSAQGTPSTAPAPTPMDAALLNIAPLKDDKAQANNDPVGLTLVNHRLLVSQSGRITLSDLSRDQPLWQQSIAGPAQEKFDSTPGLPLVVGARVFACIAADQTTALTAIDSNTQRIIWQQHIDDGVVSDPIMIGSWLYVLTVKQTDTNRFQLLLHQIEPNTGESVRDAPIAPLHGNDSTRLHTFGRPAIVGNDLLYVGNGWLIRASSLGQVRWIRQLPYFALDAMAYSPYRQDHTTPLVAGDLAIAAASGTPLVTAVDIHSGVLVWQHLDTQLRRLVGIVNNRVILVSGQSIDAIDPANGQLLWRVPFDGQATAVLPAADDHVLAVRSVTQVGSEQPTAELLWLSATDGSVTQRQMLPQVQAAHVRRLQTDGRSIVGACDRPDSPSGCSILLLRPQPTATAPKP